MIDTDYILRNLPQQLSAREEAELWEEFGDEVGGRLLVFSRESVTLEPPLAQTMDAQAWEAHEKATRHVWGARCTCTVCGESFVGAYISGKGKPGNLPGVALYEGDDGQLYDGWPEEGELGRAEIYSGEELICPYCNETVTLTDRAALGGGRSYRNLAMEQLQIGRHTVLLFWQLHRRVLPGGRCFIETLPRHAVAIGDRGELHTFRHVRGSGFYTWRQTAEWIEMSRASDPTTTIYKSIDGANGQMIGGSILRTEAENRGGTTGEKTGLTEYLNAGGRWPVKYLKVWQAHKNIEALAKTDFVRWIVKDINSRMDHGVGYGMTAIDNDIAWAELDCRRPHEMLHMTKEEFRDACLLPWTEDALLLWRDYSRMFDALPAKEFLHTLQTYGTEIAELACEYGYPLPQIAKYLRTRRRFRNGKEALRYLADWWKFVFSDEDEDGAVDTAADAARIWPTDLFAAHEDMSAKRRMGKDRKLQQGFDRIFEKYSATEWTDGRLCIRLPRKKSDLVLEGEVLRHCVGAYGNLHASGADIIFFVRKYRAPERSYYTLDVGIRGGKPRIAQLHGYGNERHGVHKEFSHTIPAAVERFCREWFETVFLPHFQKEHGKEKQSAKTTGQRRTA